MGPDARPLAEGRRVGLRLALGLRSLLPQLRRPRGSLLRELDRARRSRPGDQSSPHRAPRLRQLLPPPVRDGQDGGDARSREQRAAEPRHRRGMVRARAQELRHRVQEHAGAPGSARRGVPDHLGHVHREPDDGPRQALHGDRRDRAPEARAAAAPADHDRRQGRRVLLRIVARYADMWNIGASAEEMRDLIDVLRRHGDAVERDTGAIEKTVLLPLCYRAAPPREDFMCRLMASMRQTTPELVRRQIMIGDKQECLDTIARYRKVGATHFIFMTFTPYFVDEIQAFAEEVML